MKTLSLRLPTEIHQRLVQIAKDSERSLNAQIVLVLKTWLRDNDVSEITRKGSWLKGLRFRTVKNWTVYINSLDDAVKAPEIERFDPFNVEIETEQGMFSIVERDGGLDVHCDNGLTIKPEGTHGIWIGEDKERYNKGETK